MFAISLCLCLFVDPPNSAEEYIAKALDARRSIKTLRATMHVKYSRDSNKTKMERISTVTMSGEKSKSDEQKLINGIPQLREVYVMNGDVPGYAMFYNEEENTYSKFSRIKLDQNGTPTKLLSAVPPVFLGYTLKDIIFYQRIDQILKVKGLQDLRVRESTFRDRPVIELTFRRPQDKQEIVAILDPDYNFQVVKLTSRGAPNVKVVEIVHESFYPDKPLAGGYIFPNRVTFNVTVDGIPNVVEEITLTNVSINQPVSDGEFTLAGINPKVGTPFSSELQQYNEKEWDGTKLVPLKIRGIPIETQPPIAVTPQPFFNGWMIAGAVGLSILAATLFVLIRRLPRRS